MLVDKVGQSLRTECFVSQSHPVLFPSLVSILTEQACKVVAAW